MYRPERLFDVIDFQLEHFPKEDMLAAKVNGTWVKHNTQAVKTLINQLSSGLLQLGISPGDLSPEGQDKISIISQNRPEWIITDLAAQQIGAVVTPLYPTISEQEIEFMLTDAAVKIVFVSDQAIYDKIAPLLARVPSLQHIFSFDQLEGVRHWSEVSAMAREEDTARIAAIRDSILPEHLVSIIYTSGTTGTPKGVMLTH
ncbi:MAG TPA: AMP-binding protein, partial [Chitinophaga sp.]